MVQKRDRAIYVASKNRKILLEMSQARDVSAVSRRLKRQIDTLAIPTARKKSGLERLEYRLKYPYSS